MQNLNVHALDVSEDVKMTRVFLACPSSFFETNVEIEEDLDDIYIDEYDL
tara:strand:- start:849 stop:998 length:150 start_codon:yes stop_codon:yes gene_type:complete